MDKGLVHMFSESHSVHTYGSGSGFAIWRRQDGIPQGASDWRERQTADGDSAGETSQTLKQCAGG